MHYQLPVDDDIDIIIFLLIPVSFENQFIQVRHIQSRNVSVLTCQDVFSHVYTTASIMSKNNNELTDIVKFVHNIVNIYGKILEMIIRPWKNPI